MNGLDVVKCAQLIKDLPEHELVLRFVFENTTYVTKENVRVYSEYLLQDWLAKRDATKRLGVLFESDEIGSKHWLYFLFCQLLPDHKKLTTKATQDELDNIDELLFLEDFSLTGQSLIDDFDQLSYKKSTKHISVQIILAFAAGYFLREIHGYVGKNFREVNYLAGKVLVQPKNFLLSVAFHRAIGNNELRDMLPFHAEYKIPDSFCTYSTLYEKCRDAPDRSFMKEVELFWSNLV